ncbi:MAG: molybdopterin-dependent oxidoreductase [Actinobacteria bacterium]|nr:molybdopterin-dependent oxidoreductase [Actinomycetota bacterium]
MNVNITLNDVAQNFTVDPADTLLELLRREGCFSVRYGSDSGETGASAILLDGRLASSEVILAAQADGHRVDTVEGLSAKRDDLDPVQAAFVAVGGFQSGYSAGALILATHALLADNPSPTETEIRDALSGVLDRETAYVKAVEAVKRAASVLRGEATEPFRPAILAPLTDGVRPVAYEAGATAPNVSPAIPRLIPSTDVPDMAVVGKPELKVDGVKLARGNPTFADDVELRGMLHAKVLRSPHAHARILDIDDSAAVALPGVHAVKHYKNTPRVLYASGGQSWPNPHPWDQVSFDNKVRHVGDRVAAVAAESPAIAEEACRLIKVTYEVLSFVLDENEAMADGVAVIHDEADAVGVHDASRNLALHIKAQTVSDANIEKAFASAAHVFENTYRVQQVQQTPIEPHVSVAWLDEDERLILRTATQVPFHVRRIVAPLLGLQVKDIRVMKPRVGGGFGAKQEMLIEDIVGHLALATKRPVRLVLDREEEFASSRTRHPQTLTFKTGVDKNGKLVAQQLNVTASTGAYGTHGFTVQNVTGLRGLSSYNCPAKKFDCHVVYTNIPVPGAFRGYGAPQAEFALECHMEDIARSLGREVIDFKRQNWVKVGDKLDIVMFLGERGTLDPADVDPASFPPVMTSGIEECVAQAMRAIGWHRRDDPSWVAPADRPHIRRGIGFAFCMHGTAIPFLDMGGCSIKMNDDGSFNVMSGAADLGTGADTVLGQIAAEVLGVPLDDIIMYTGDTDMTPFDVGAYASSTTYISGSAVKKAADVVRWRIKLRAARLLGVEEPCSIELHDRRAWAPDGRSISLEDIALNSLHTEDHEQIMGTGSHVSHECPPPFAAQFAEIEVDTETGQVTVVKLVMAVDCGVAINPITASGQVEGGMFQALGYAVCEEFAFDETGRMVNAEFGPYWIFRADDAPATEVFLVQTMEDSGPFGAKAVAEIPTDGVAPAVRNALLQATGVAINQIPFTPERVYHALNSRS